MKMLLTLAISVLVFYAAALLFHAVLPAPAAWVLAAIVALIELVGAARNGIGSGLRALVRVDLTLLVWPAAALLLQFAGMSDRPARIALAAAVASAAGIAASRHGSGAESQRLYTVLAAIGIPLYAVIHVIVQPVDDPLALAAAALAGVVAALVVRGALVWPDPHRRWLLLCAAACGASALICAVPVLIHPA